MKATMLGLGIVVVVCIIGVVNRSNSWQKEAAGITTGQTTTTQPSDLDQTEIQMWPDGYAVSATFSIAVSGKQEPIRKFGYLRVTFRDVNCDGKLDAVAVVDKDHKTRIVKYGATEEGMPAWADWVVIYGQICKENHISFHK